MTAINAILLAAARGARLQVRPGPFEEWTSTRTSVDGIQNYPGHFRVHPDDEHLRFGLVSSALHEAAKEARSYNTELGWSLAHDAILWYLNADNLRESVVYLDSRLDWWSIGYKHRSLFLLLLAEALADEGL